MYWDTFLKRSKEPLVPIMSSKFGKTLKSVTMPQIATLAWPTKMFNTKSPLKPPTQHQLKTPSGTMFSRLHELGPLGVTSTCQAIPAEPQNAHSSRCFIGTGLVQKSTAEARASDESKHKKPPITI